jgi:hypothetical protein
MEEMLWILGPAGPEMELIETVLHEAGQSVALASRGEKRLMAGENALGYLPDSRGVSALSLHQYDKIVLVGATYEQPHPLASATETGRLPIYRHDCRGYLVLPLANTRYSHDVEVVRLLARPERPPNAFIPASLVGQVFRQLARDGMLMPDGTYAGAGFATVPPLWASCSPAERPWEAGVFIQESRAPGGWVVLTEEQAKDTGKIPFLQLAAIVTITAAIAHCPADAQRGLCPGVLPEDVQLFLP